MASQTKHRFARADTVTRELELGGQDEIETQLAKQARFAIAPIEQTRPKDEDGKDEETANAEEERKDDLGNLEILLGGGGAIGGGGRGGRGVRGGRGGRGGRGCRGVLKKPAAAKGPSWGYEDSRGQILCRTGTTGPGSSYAIKYEVVGGKANAKKIAETWVQNKLKEAK